MTFEINNGSRQDLSDQLKLTFLNCLRGIKRFQSGLSYASEHKTESYSTAVSPIEE